MFRGFYTLSSGMLAHNKNLNVISNNLTNVSTPGYKADELISGTFKEELLFRTSNNTTGAKGEALGSISLITVPDETLTDFSQGALEETGGNLDFAIMGEGFFQIQGSNGDVYTRNGSFIIDNEGYLCLQGTGRVLGSEGEIFLPTDDFNVKSDGSIVDGSGKQIAKISIVEFDTFDGFKKIDEGVFSANAEGKESNSNILWKHLESSNVDPAKELTSMLISQRTIQSAAQVLKMYDGLMEAATTEIGKV